MSRSPTAALPARRLLVVHTPSAATLSPAGVLANYNITNTPAQLHHQPEGCLGYGDGCQQDLWRCRSDPDRRRSPASCLRITSQRPTAALRARPLRQPISDQRCAQPGGVLANYNITNTPANFTINKKDASVTPDALSKVMGTAGSDPDRHAHWLPACGYCHRRPTAAPRARPMARIRSPPRSTRPACSATTTSPTPRSISPLPRRWTEYTLTINITGHGTVTKSPDQATYHYGDVVTLTATADPGWTFFNWSANAPGEIVTIHDNTTVTALFTQDEYNL